MAYDLRSANPHQDDSYHQQTADDSHNILSEEEEEDLLLSVSGYKILSGCLTRRALRPWALLFSGWTPTLLPSQPSTPRKTKTQKPRGEGASSSPSMSVESYMKLHNKLKRAPLRTNRAEQSFYRELSHFLKSNQHTLLLLCAVFALALFFNRFFLY